MLFSKTDDKVIRNKNTLIFIFIPVFTPKIEGKKEIQNIKGIEKNSFALNSNLQLNHYLGY